MDFEKVLEKYRQLSQQSKDVVPTIPTSIPSPSPSPSSHLPGYQETSTFHSNDWRMPPNTSSSSSGSFSIPPLIEPIQSISFAGPSDVLQNLQSPTFSSQSDTICTNDTNDTNDRNEYVELCKKQIPHISSVDNNVRSTSSSHPIFGENPFVASYPVMTTTTNTSERPKISLSSLLSLPSKTVVDEMESTTTFHERDPRKSSTYMSRQDIESNIRFLLEENTRLQKEIHQVESRELRNTTQLEFIKQLLGIDDDEIEYEETLPSLQEIKNEDSHDQVL